MIFYSSGASLAVVWRVWWLTILPGLSLLYVLDDAILDLIGQFWERDGGGTGVRARGSEREKEK